MKKLTRTQKMYFAVLCTVLLAFVFDQVLLSPGKAGAAETAKFHASASPAARAAATADRIPELLASVRKPERTLASRFNDLAREESLDVENIEDALRAPASWFPSGEPVLQPVHVENPENDKIAERFRKSHRLNAVMGNAQGGYAIVVGADGRSRSLRIGQDLDGFRLIEVRPRSIMLERAGTTVELTLPDNG